MTLSASAEGVKRNVSDWCSSSGGISGKPMLRLVIEKRCEAANAPLASSVQ